MRKKVINLLYNHRFLSWLLPIYHRLIGKSKFIIRGENYFDYNNSNLYKTVISLESGKNNKLLINKNTFISNSNFKITGSNNTITIGASGFINGLLITIEGDNSSIYIGDNMFILDKTKLIAVDGSTIRIGNGCMFSDNIDIRTTDNHAIIDRKTGKRINYEEDIEFGNNVWIGTRVNILKGVHLADGTIVGAGSVVTNDNPYPNTIIAGNPAKKIKENVDWKMERIIK